MSPQMSDAYLVHRQAVQPSHAAPAFATQPKRGNQQEEHHHKGLRLIQKQPSPKSASQPR